MTSHVRAAFAYLRRASTASASSSTPGSAAGRGRGSSSRARRPLRRVHPVGEVEHVEPAEQPLGGGMAGQLQASASHASGQRPRAQLDVDALERLADRAPARGLVGANATISCSPGRGLGEPGERAADVVADARRRMRERADVEGDPHGR